MRGLELIDAVRQDHQSPTGASTTSRRWAPTSARRSDGKGRRMMVDWRYATARRCQPPDAEVRKLRPAD
jgi:hypothetical protein